VACKVFNCRIGGEHPAILVACKPDGIVHIHLDKVLIETIIATTPPPDASWKRPEEITSCQQDQGRAQRNGWVRVQEIGLSFLG